MAKKFFKQEHKKILEEKQNYGLNVAEVDQQYKDIRKTFSQKEAEIFASDRTLRDCQEILDKKKRQVIMAKRDLEQTKMQLEKVMGE